MDNTTQVMSMNELRLHNPLSVLKYGIKNKLLNHQGWEWAKLFLPKKRELKGMLRVFKTATMKKRNEIKYEFGVQIPRTVQEALELDRINGNNLWEEAIMKELTQMADFDTFRVVPDGEPLPGFKCIPYRIIFAVKFDRRRKARLVVGGHLTQVPKEDCYSPVVSMDGVRLGFMIARNNELLVCAGDVGNAFLNGFSHEKIYIIAGPEFGPKLHGKRLIIYKSIYGLCTSAARFHEHLSDVLVKMNYRPSKADPDLWYIDKGTHYEYITRYVDNVIIFGKDQMKTMKELEKEYVLKGVGTPQYYLGGDVVQLDKHWENEGIYTAFSAETYIRNCLPRLAKLCNKEQFAKSNSPMDNSYHPEMDTTELCNPETISKYRSLIGSANWIITLGRFDIQYVVNTFARYSHAPREGHFKALQRIFGYLRKWNKGKIVIDNGIAPITNKLKLTKNQNWTEMYPDTEEDTPKDMPERREKEMHITTYVDADHARDKVTRRSVTRVLLLVNNTPLMWTSKRQPTVEISTYGLELIATRIAVDMTIEAGYKLRMLGIPVMESSLLVGDNMSVVLNTTIPSSPLKKKHLRCAYNYVREAIAAGIINYGHIDTNKNMADLLTKPLPTGLFRTPKQSKGTENKDSNPKQLIEGE